MRAALLLLLLAGVAEPPGGIVVGPYLQDATSASIVVAWECAPAAAGAVIVGPAGAERRIESTASARHEVRVDLAAAARVPYRVTCGAVESPAYTLAPLPSGDRFTFLVYGDNRDGDAEHAKVAAAMAGEHADLILQTGDMVSDAAEDVLWRRFFAIERDLLADAPMFPALGNHELLHDPTAAHFHRYFALPGPRAREERYYSFRAGNALFVALDGNQSRSRPQAQWMIHQLDAARADPTIAHLFVFFHQPAFSVGDFCGSAAEQGLWVPEFEEEAPAKLRAVFTGHDHSYQRLERAGVRYFVAGGGGAPLHHQSAHCPAYDRQASKVFRDVYHYLRVDVRGPQVEASAIAVSGEVIDRVSLHEPPPAEAAPPEVAYLDAPLRAHPHRFEARRFLPTVVVVALVALAAALYLARRRQRP